MLFACRKPTALAGNEESAKLGFFERIKLLSGWVAGGGGHVARPAER
jgi:hypothetical protein